MPDRIEGSQTSEAAGVARDVQPLLEDRGVEGPVPDQTFGERAVVALKNMFSWTTRSRQSAGEQVSTTDDDIPVIVESNGKVNPSDASSSSQTEISDQPAEPGEKRPNPVCLICLEEMTEGDFSSGRAIALECACRGDLALRHKECATKWAQVKDDGRGGVPTCELCKQPVRNLPPVPPRPRPVEHIEVSIIDDGYDSQYMTFVPTTADLVFDCVRVTWVAMIISVLFFESSLGAALWTGLVAGFAYSMMVRIMYRQHFAAMRMAAEENRLARQRAAEIVPPRVQIAVADAV